MLQTENEFNFICDWHLPLTSLSHLCLSTAVSLAEWSKALRSGRSPLLWAWVRIPLLTKYFFFTHRSATSPDDAPDFIFLIAPEYPQLKCKCS